MNTPAGWPYPARMLGWVRSLAQINDLEAEGIPVEQVDEYRAQLRERAGRPLVTEFEVPQHPGWRGPG